MSTVKPPKPVIMVPTDMPQTSLAELRKGGYIPIVTNRPESVRLVIAHAEILSSDILMSAMHGIVKCGITSGMEIFTKELYQRMQLRESEQNETR